MPLPPDNKRAAGFLVSLGNRNQSVDADEIERLLTAIQQLRGVLGVQIVTLDKWSAVSAAAEG